MIVEVFQRSIEEKDKLKMDDLFLCFALIVLNIPLV